MPPNRRRPLGHGGGPQPPEPPRRRSLGPGGAAQPPAPPPPGREENTGANPWSNRFEQTLFGGAPRTPTSINSSPPGTREELDEAVSRAAAKLSPAKGLALQRAFAGDDSLLLTKRPTNSSDPPRPRTLAAGWDADSKTLFVRFRGRHLSGNDYADGVGYEYYGVTRADWREIRDGPSPGKYINRVLNKKRYTPAVW